MTASDDPFATRALRVTAMRWEAEAVVTLELRDPGEGTLPAWVPGAHIELRLPSGLIRQYSLCGDPDDASHYTVAVLREPNGRGGSREIHDTALVGRTVAVRGPRNHFELRPAPSYVFLAGGIGVTPIRAMARAAARAGTPWTLHYGGRSARHMAFRDDLASLASPKHHVALVPQDTHGVLDLAAILADAPAEAVVYACGPEGMLRAVEQACAETEPPRTLRLERFAAASSTGAPVPAGGDTAFEVELRRSGLTVTVPPDRTVLDAVRDVLPDAPASCEEGFCGTCETRVLDGRPDHRDQILTDDEKEESATMMICVSRCRDHRLVLDL